MEVSGIVVGEGSPCSGELPGSSNCEDIEMGKSSQEDLSFPSTMEKTTGEEENDDCEDESLVLLTGTGQVQEGILPCETAPESLLPVTGSIEEENLHGETLESLATDIDPMQQENVPCENVLDSPLAEVDTVEGEHFLCERIESLAATTNPSQEDISAQEELLSSSIMEENSHYEMVHQLSLSDNEIMRKETTCNNPATSSIENDVGEEEIPLAEAVTLYCHDVDGLQYNAEYQSSDPLAFDQENGDPSSIIIKDEPIDDPEEEVLCTEDVADEMCIKIENDNEHSLAFGEIVSFEDKEYSQNLNLDQIHSSNCSENDDYNSFLTQNSFHSEISTLGHMSKLHGKSADFTRNISLRKQQDELVERQGNTWHSVTMMKQEDVEQNVVNRRNKNQMLNSYMVKIPQPGFYKCKIDEPGVFACEFCGKQFNSSCAQRGHLSKCQQRRRSIKEFSKRRENKQDIIESKTLNISSSHEACEDSVKPTVQLRNSFNNKKDYLHYDCDLCEKAFPTLQGFAIHSRRHARIDMDLQCLNCPMSFPTREKLSLHCKKSGHHCKKFKCSLCSKAFFTKLSLRKHEEIHDESDYLFCCTHCDKTFESVIKLQKHQQHCQLVEKNSQDFKKSTNCSVCGQKYKSVKRLVRHMKWHANEKYNECPVCKKKFMNKDNLKKHKVVHQAEGKFCCDLCDRVFETVSNLKKHVLRHTGQPSAIKFTSPPGNTCDRCHQSFSSISGLYGHSAHCRGKRKKKFFTRNKSNVSSNFKNFQPVQNEVIILNSKIKIKFKRKDTQQVFENITLPAAHDSKPHLNKCDLCKKTYTSQRNLERHRLIHFGQMVRDTENNVLCGICGNLFSSNITLLRHQQLHKVGQQFQCLICRKLFPASRNLKIHMHSHRTEDKESFNCDLCNKAFSSEIHLKYHRRTHAGIVGAGVHVCSKCQKSFTTFQGLNSHRRHCPYQNFAIEHTASSSKEYSTKQTVLRTPPSAIKQNSNEKIMLKSSKPLQLSLNNTCHICNKKFSSQVLLKYHLRQHSSETSLTCFNCKKTFETYRGLSGHLSHCPVRHVVMAGLQSRLDETLQCHICEKTTNNLENYMSHMRTHAKDLSFSCDICGKVLGTSQARRIHMKRYHSDGEIFMTTNPVKPITTVKKATSTHVTPSSQQYGLPSPSHSSRSDDSVRNAQPMSDLSSPEQNYKNYFIIKRSTGGLQKYICTICNKVLQSRKNLKFHFYLHSGDSRYKCDICGAVLHSAGALKTHSTRKHSSGSICTNEVNVKIMSDEVDIIPSKSVMNDTDKMRDKNISNKVDPVFMKEAALQVSREKSVFQCNYCPRTFDIISKRRMHEASHLRALKCSVCDGSFRTHKDFKEHVCADNFFPLLCEHCGVQFTDDSSFTSHSCSLE